MQDQSAEARKAFGIRLRNLRLDAGLNASSDAKTPASSDHCLAVRRVGRTTQVQLCDLTCPERLALMSAKYWCDWKFEVGQGLFLNMMATR